MATTSPDDIWTPDAGDNYALTTDLAAMADTVQDAITDVRNNGKYRVITNAERLALTGSDLYEGLRVWTSDTKIRWVYTSAAWKQEGVGPVAHNINPGANISGISIPGTAVSVPQGLMIKTGMVTSNASPAFGNEYMPRVVFGQAFPTSLLSVTVLQIGVDGAVPFAGAVATDDATATGFRVFYAGTSTSTKRSFTWTAIGY